MPELLTRACGCGVEFYPKLDGYDEIRREKLGARFCPHCAQKRDREESARAAAARAAATPRAETSTANRLIRGNKSDVFPDGAEVFLRFTTGHWRGRLAAGGVTVEAESLSVIGTVLKLARKWSAAARRQAAA